MIPVDDSAQRRRKYKMSDPPLFLRCRYCHPVLILDSEFWGENKFLGGILYGFLTKTSNFGDFWGGGIWNSGGWKSPPEDTWK